MSAIVLMSCDRDVGEGTCPASAYGRVGEDIHAATARAVKAGWRSRPHPAGRHMPDRFLCPWHATGGMGGTGPL